MIVPKAYRLQDLPEEAQCYLLSLHALKDREEYRRSRAKRESAGGLFTPDADDLKIDTVIKPLIWATSAPSGAGAHSFSDPITLEAAMSIQPRVEKTKEEQKARVKQRAEVFTPSWVCNLQNNLIDDEVLYPGAFNTSEGPASKTWTPTSDSIKFTDDYTWAHYVTENRLEMTCGEGPYLFSRYDTVSGTYIPVRDDEGRWMRIGLLDRKLRVVSEQKFATSEEWRDASLYALRATFGFEWQGDNLLLARLNGLNTLVDYHKEVWGSLPPEEYLIAASEILSWNLWQMDGLKLVIPESCVPECSACEQKTRAGHQGILALVRFGSTVKVFEDLLPSSFFSKARAKKASAKKIGSTKKPAPMGEGLFSI